MEGFAVTCPLAPDASRLISGFCSSPRSFGLSFLQTPPRDDALALLPAFGSAKTWPQDFHLRSNVPCPAHTIDMRGVVGLPRHVLSMEEFGGMNLKPRCQFENLRWNLEHGAGVIRCIGSGGEIHDIKETSTNRKIVEIKACDVMEAGLSCARQQTSVD